MTDDKYLEALRIQRFRKTVDRMTKEHRHLGIAGEKCPRCGGDIETLLSSKGDHPMRCCWACEIKDLEREQGDL